MKLIVAAFFFMCLCLTLAVYTQRLTNRSYFQDGFDSGRADVLRQMHNCISSNDSQWVQDKKYIWVYPHPLFGPREAEKHYTNRFFTNWTLVVRQP